MNPLAAEAIVVLDRVERTFAGTPPVRALKQSNLTIHRNDYVAIVGPSGSGKSTLLHLLGLLDSPTAGTYWLEGVDTASLNDNGRAGMRAERLGFVFQSFHLLGHRTALENVMLAEIHRRGGAKDRHSRATSALTRVGLGHRLDAYPTTLSGGERQRVAVARALIGEPSLLLADESTGNLDSKTSESILELFDTLHSSGLTLAVITHDDHVSERAQRRVRIHDGLLTPLVDAVPR